MKNTIKLFGIIALVAVIGFSMAACDNGGGTNPNIIRFTVVNDHAAWVINTVTVSTAPDGDQVWLFGVYGVTALLLPGESRVFRVASHPEDALFVEIRGFCDEGYPIHRYDHVSGFSGESPTVTLNQDGEIE